MTNSITIKSKAVQRKFLANIKSYLSDPKNSVLNSLSRNNSGDLITTDEKKLERLAYSGFEKLKALHKYKLIKKNIIATSAYIEYDEVYGIMFDDRNPHANHIERFATAKLNKGDVFDPIKNVLHKGVFYLELNTHYNSVYSLDKVERRPLIITSTEVQVIDGKMYPILLITTGYSNEKINKENIILVDKKVKSESHSQYISTVNSEYLNCISNNVLCVLTNYINDWFN